MITRFAPFHVQTSTSVGAPEILGLGKEALPFCYDSGRLHGNTRYPLNLPHNGPFLALPHDYHCTASRRHDLVTCPSILDGSRMSPIYINSATETLFAGVWNYCKSPGKAFNNLSPNTEKIKSFL